MPNPIIQNYLKDENIPKEKRVNIYNKLQSGANEEEIASAISNKYGNTYVDESRQTPEGEMSVSEFLEKQAQPRMVGQGKNSRVSGARKGDAEATKERVKKEIQEQIFGKQTSFKDRWEGIKEGFGDAIDRGKEDFKEAGTNFDKGNLKSFGRGVLDLGASVGNFVTSPIAGGIGAAKPEIQSTIENVSSITPGFVKKGASKVWENVPEGVKNVGEDVLEASGLLAAGATGNVLKSTLQTAKNLSKVPLRGVNAVTSPVLGGIKNTGNWALKKLTGISDDAMDVLKNEPILYKAAQKGEITQESLADNVIKAIKSKSDEMSLTGKGYETIRKLKDLVPVPKASVSNLLSKRGIVIGDKGKLNFKGSNIGSEVDKNAVKNAIDEINGYSDNISANDYLNLRSKLDDYVNFESQVSSKGKDLVKLLRREVDQVAKDKLPGLKELDASYGPQIKEFKQLKKDYMNMDGTLKDNAFSKITNLTKKGKEQILSRLEEASPGIGSKIKALSALEDVKYAASGRSVGSYLSPMVGTAGMTTGNVPMILAAVLSNPKVAANLVIKYGRSVSASKSVINSVKNKIISGQKLNPYESKIMSKILSLADSKLSKASAVTAGGLESKELLNEG